jgi:hypothetical protein
MTHWTPYVCSACGGKSAFHTGAMMLLGGIGGGVGAYFGRHAIGLWGWLGIVALIFVWVIVLTLAEWLLLELHPEREAPNQTPDRTRLDAAGDSGSPPQP